MLDAAEEMTYTGLFRKSQTRPVHLTDTTKARSTPLLL